MDARGSSSRSLEKATSRSPPRRCAHLRLRLNTQPADAERQPRQETGEARRCRSRCLTWRSTQLTRRIWSPRVKRRYFEARPGRRALAAARGRLDRVRAGIDGRRIPIVRVLDRALEVARELGRTGARTRTTTGGSATGDKRLVGAPRSANRQKLPQHSVGIWTFSIALRRLPHHFTRSASCIKGPSGSFPMELGGLEPPTSWVRSSHAPTCGRGYLQRFLNERLECRNISRNSLQSVLRGLRCQ